MARKPSIILTVADKQSAAKDLRAEIKATKARLVDVEAGIKSATNLVTALKKQIAELTEKIATLKT